MVFDHSQILEKNLQNNIAFLLNNDLLFSKVAYKIMQNNKDDILIKCIQSKTNGKIQLTYLTEEFLTLDRICLNLNEEQLFGMILGLLRRLKKLSENGYLDFSCLLVELDKIFVDAKTLDIRFIYIPFQKKNTSNQLSKITELRSNLIRCLQLTALYINKSKKIISLINLLEDGTLSLDLMIKSLTLLIGKTSEDMGNKKIHLCIVNKKTGKIIELGDEELVLGRKAPTEKGTILDSQKLIGREHCKITCCGNDTYITDLKSLNGTFLNGRRLEPQKKVRISEGDVLALAYEKFSVRRIESEDAI